MNDSQFGRRQRGTGNVAEMIADTFRVWRNKLGFTQESQALNAESFRQPTPTNGQKSLF
jgi:hypothetical protein